MRRAFRGVRFSYVGLSACVSALLLSACTKPAPDAASSAPPAVTTTAAANTATEPSSELKWARLALARNPTLEIIATDTAAGVFTVRFKDTGEVRAVKLDDLAAAPIAALREAPARVAATREPTPAATATSATDTVAAPGAPAATTPGSAATMSQAAPSNYTIERADGQVKVSGPGVSIVSSGANTVSATAGDAQQRAADPIICEGRRMLHFDNRNIYVEGDAIIARGGCELYITNSRVVADGTGVVVRGAVVHISNSTIEGGAASFDADDTARVYVRSSTFQGLPRRSEHATVQDQGGNQWR